jgi:asparagine synthase (glutamine-hydrolysing)
MCGIAGYFSVGDGDERATETLRAMAAALVHRGPDDFGLWSDSAGVVGLAHRRLSILDLSPAGHQPMRSHNQRYVVAFNGEIYNFLEVRKELEMAGAAPPWRGHSDTEVMLASFEHWGVRQSLDRFVGMFAIALWDQVDRSLYLVRDRLGEKPLYYGWMGNVLLFGSELKALRRHPAWRAEINREALALFLRYSYIPAPHSIYQGIAKIIPGTYLRFDFGRREPRANNYWEPKRIAEEGQHYPLDGRPVVLTDHLERLLRNAVAQQMVADVPLGAFLSGGIDSSAIVALMQSQTSRPVKTFTIGFNESAYDEARHAKAVASHLGTDHTELFITGQEALATIPLLPTVYDEPFADPSQIPTFLVSKLARSHVTVCLSGDGGDELFGGYNRYLWGASIWRTIRWIPQPARKLVASSLTSLSPAALDSMLGALGMKQRSMGDKVHKLAKILDAGRAEDLYLGLLSHWANPGAVVLDVQEPPTLPAMPELWPSFAQFPTHMMYIDALTYLPDDILVKVDRAAMAVGLESRVPFLDHRIVEFAWRLPPYMKIRGQQGKWLLRQVLYRHVPKGLIERPKMGFGVPIGAWLRGPLRQWAEALLSETKLQHEGFFRSTEISRKWREHQEGSRNWQHPLWNVLMFQAWLAAAEPT